MKPSYTSKRNSAVQQGTAPTAQASSLTGKLVKAFALLTCLWVGYWAYHFTIASLYILASERQMALWNQAPQNVSEGDVEKVSVWLNRAIDYDPRHPHYYNLLGKSLQWLAYVQLTEQQQRFTPIALTPHQSAQSSLQQAKQAYLKGAELRPEWALTWADLAQVEHQLNGDALLDYLRYADHFGPYMGEVNLTIASIGLERWNQLDREMRTLSMHHMERALRHPQAAQRFARHAEALEKLSLACVLANRISDTPQSPIRACRKVTL
ncbi:VpsP family polysaccharide biosynthesis protein [Vibrio vulnificus]|nr:VpsP family polysaccharide biosynthesis protein [Vibrio vulnificus]